MRKPYPKGTKAQRKLMEYCLFEPFNSNNVLSCTSSRHFDLKDLLEKWTLTEKDIVQAEQVHGAEFAYVNEKDKGREIPGVDGLITDKKGVPLIIRTADCLPVFLYAEKIPVIGLLHAGRRGTQEKIAEKAVKKLVKDLGIAPGEIKAALGPGIKKCCYEIDRATHEHYDLCAENKMQLLSGGLQEQNIVSSDICTSCREDICYSYRREGSTGRLYSILMLK